MSIERIDTDFELDTDDPFEHRDRDYSPEYNEYLDLIADIKFPLWAIDQLVSDLVNSFRGDIGEWDKIEIADVKYEYPNIISIRKRRIKKGIAYNAGLEKAYLVFEAACRWRFQQGLNTIGVVCTPLQHYPELSAELSDFDGWTPIRRERAKRNASQNEIIRLAKDLDNLKIQIEYVDKNISEYEQDAYFMARMRDYKKKRARKRELSGRLNSLKQKARRWSVN